MAASETHRAIESVYRIERARLVAGLVRLVRDLSLAEDLAQDALVAALSEWPKGGVPPKPGAWLMATAKRRAIDTWRRQEVLARKQPELAFDLEQAQEALALAVEAGAEDGVGDELLALMFTACHPILAPEARVALTLRLLGGLSTDEIARAFLVPEATVAQRIVRAKKKLGEAGLAFELPQGAERGERLASVLEVLYLVFNEGYAATAGEDLIRPALCAEAQRLGRILTALMPEEPEVWGLLALMELQASRLATRTGPDGAFVPLTQQKRSAWDRLLIERGLKALAQAEALGGADGPYALQAALGACHARARRAEDTDWVAIAGLYDRLMQQQPGPVVGLNRAVAHSMAFGPEAGLTLLEALPGAENLRQYMPFAAARGDFLFRAGRKDEARLAFEEAAGLTRNAVEQAHLRKRALACDEAPSPLS